MALATPTAAAASDFGEFYQTVSVDFHPENDLLLLVSTTFGLLLSTDDGATFHWICGEAIGYGGVYAPRSSVSADGAIYATSFKGLQVSRDGGCTWEGVGGEIGSRFAADVTISADGRVFAATAIGTEPNDVFVARDGRTFDPVGIDVPGARWRQVASAPRHPERLFLGGTRPGESGTGAEPLLYRSDDGGESFVPLITDGWFPEGTIDLLIAGISPADPDVAFIRAIGREGEPGGLYRSDDAGQSWELTLDLPTGATPFGLTVSGGGTRVMAGTSVPCPGDDPESPEGCVFVSHEGGATWERADSQPRMHCAGARPADDSLFACAVDGEPDNFALGRSTSAEFWDPVLRLPDVAGPLECPAATTQARCAANDWPLLCRQLGACPEPEGVPPPSPQGGCCDSGGDPAAALILFLVLPICRRPRHPHRAAR